MERLKFVKNYFSSLKERKRIKAPTRKIRFTFKVEVLQQSLNMDLRKILLVFLLFEMSFIEFCLSENKTRNIPYCGGLLPICGLSKYCLFKKGLCCNWRWHSGRRCCGCGGVIGLLIKGGLVSGMKLVGAAAKVIEIGINKTISFMAGGSFKKNIHIGGIDVDIDKSVEIGCEKGKSIGWGNGNGNGMGNGNGNGIGNGMGNGNGNDMGNGNGNGMGNGNGNGMGNGKGNGMGKGNGNGMGNGNGNGMGNGNGNGMGNGNGNGNADYGSYGGYGGIHASVGFGGYGTLYALDHVEGHKKRHGAVQVSSSSGIHASESGTVHASSSKAVHTLDSIEGYGGAHVAGPKAVYVSNSGVVHESSSKGNFKK